MISYIMYRNNLFKFTALINVSVNLKASYSVLPVWDEQNEGEVERSAVLLMLYLQQ